MVLPAIFGRFTTPLLVAILLVAQPFATVVTGQETAETTTEAATDQAADIDPNVAQQQAEEALAAGDFDKAMQEFTKLATWGQQNAYTHADGQNALGLGITGRGRVLAKMQEYEAALEQFKQILDSNRDYVPALIARGEMFLELGANEQALMDFQTAVKNARGRLPAQFGFGKASVLVGLYQQGIGPLTRVLAAEPEHAEALRLRGIAYANVYKTSDAYNDLRESIRIDPESHDSYFALGEVLFRDKQYERAVEQFTKAIENYTPRPGREDEPYLQGYLTRSLVYVELGKDSKDPAAKKAAYENAVADATTLLEQLDENNPGHTQARAATLHSRGVGERMLGDLPRAIRTFSEAVQLNPELGESYYRRGICYHYLGEEKMAIADFVQAANISFSDPRANLWEGFTYAKLGDYHQAIRAYGNAIAASDRYAPAYVNRGLAYMMLGQYEKAVNDFNEAIRLEPAVASHYYHRGVAYERLRDYEKASNSLASAIELDNKHAGAYRHMASTMQSLGRSELASQYRQKADELGPATTSPSERGRE